MRFALSEDQAAFAEAVSSLLADRATPTQIRAAWASPSGQIDGLHRSLGELGLLGLMVPADVGGGLGGVGLGMVELVAILERCGAHAVPDGVASSVIGAATLARAMPTSGSEELGAQLSAVLRGERTISIQTSSAHSFQGQDAAAAPGLLTLAGADPKSLVLFREGEELWLTPQGPKSLAAVGAGSGAGASGGLHASVDGARRIVQDWAPDPSAPRYRVAVADETRELWHFMMMAATVASAAELIGLGNTMLDLTVTYVGERRQFGVPVGSFQAVKHQLANAKIALGFAWPAVLRAAYGLDLSSPVSAPEEPSLAVRVSMAKALAAEAAELSGRVGLQCHGAIAYTVENDFQLFLKRAWALSAEHGDSAHHVRQVARGLNLVAGES